MSDMALVLVICGGVLLFLMAFVALAMQYTKISRDYEELDPYDHDFREYAEPVTGCGDKNCSCGEYCTWCNGRCCAYDGYGRCRHHEPGDSQGR